MNVCPFILLMKRTVWSDSTVEKNSWGYFCTAYEIERFRIYGCDVFGAPSRWLTGVPTGWDSWINKLRILYNNYKYVCTKLFIKIIKKKSVGSVKKGMEVRDNNHCVPRSLNPTRQNGRWTKSGENWNGADVFLNLFQK